MFDKHLKLLFLPSKAKSSGLDVLLLVILINLKSFSTFKSGWIWASYGLASSGTICFYRTFQDRLKYNWASAGRARRISFRGTALVGALERFQTRTIFRVIAKSSKSSPVLDVFHNSSASVDFLTRTTGFLWIEEIRRERIIGPKSFWTKAMLMFRTLLGCSFKVVLTKRAEP